MLNIMLTLLSVLCDVYAWAFSKSLKRNDFVITCEKFHMLDDFGCIFRKLVYGLLQMEYYKDKKLNSFIRSKASKIKKYTDIQTNYFGLPELYDFAEKVFGIGGVMYCKQPVWRNGKGKKIGGLVYKFTRQEFMKVYSCLYMFKELLSNKMVLDILDNKQKEIYVIRMIEQIEKHKDILHMKRINFTPYLQEE